MSAADYSAVVGGMLSSFLCGAMTVGMLLFVCGLYAYCMRILHTASLLAAARKEAEQKDAARKLRALAPKVPPKAAPKRTRKRRRP